MLGTIEDPKFRVGPFLLPAGLIVGAMTFVLWLLTTTLRLRFEDRAGYTQGTHRGGYIFVFWHNQMIGALLGFRRHYGKRKGVAVLTSASGEGTILARIVAAFGLGAARGSSSRQGLRATRQLAKILREGRDIAITPDGPRGPRHRLALGPVFLAGATGEPVLIMRLEYSRCLRLPTWDGFAIPLPFSRVDLTLLPLQFVAGTEASLLEAERQRLEALMQPTAS